MAEPHAIPSDSRFQDLSGRVFGKWTVLFYAGRKSGKYSLWHCRCECGREKTLISSSLTLGRTQQCSSCHRRTLKPNKKPIEDLSGQTFGRLTVMSFARRGLRNKIFWTCSCSCGETTVARSDGLKNGSIASCGCLTIARRWIDQPVPTERSCSECGDTLALTMEFFYRHPFSLHGFSKKCKHCCRKISSKRNREGEATLRMKTLVHYSGDPPRCQCPGCQETHLEFLTIDHIHGGGGKHREAIGGKIHSWLRKNKYPPGFRILCMNCNHARGRYGYCPHEK